MSNKEVAREYVESALTEMGIDPDEVNDVIYPQYSGKFMYGDTCFGLELTGIHELAEFAFLLGGEPESNWNYALMENTQMDGMGKDNKIFYWPGWSISEGDESDEDDDG